MLITSAEVQRRDLGRRRTRGGSMRRRWPITWSLIGSSQYQIFFRNSALVSIFVVTLTMLISVPAAFALSRMKFWGSATLATGVFLTYLIPETLLFMPLFKMFALQRADRHRADQPVVGAAASSTRR
jgi:ABC-type glycerol-3-phosphate transport system permease component